MQKKIDVFFIWKTWDTKKEKGTEEEKDKCCFNVASARTSHTPDPKCKVIYLLYEIFSSICIPNL